MFNNDVNYDEKNDGNNMIIVVKTKFTIYGFN